MDYVPLEADEQTALDKLDSGDEVYVEVAGWGYHPSPDLRWGDKRLQIRFPMRFTKPDFLVPVSEFHLRLKTRGGDVLYEETKPVGVNPSDSVNVRAGVEFEMVWDLWIEEISDDLVDDIVPAPASNTVMALDHRTGELDVSDDG